MNFRSMWLERVLFAAILFFFVLPPIFISAPSESAFVTWNFPFAQITHASFAAAIFLLCKKAASKNNCSSVNSTSKMPRWLRYFLYAFATFAMLCAVAILFEFIAKKLNVTSSQIVLLPKNTKQFIFCVITYFCAAFYEEVIYRFYLPEMAQKIADDFFSHSKTSKSQIIETQNILQKSCRFFFELAAIILFALAHRYLGNFALANSVLAAIILRVCFVKTQNILPCVMAHGFYNLLMLFLFAR